MNESRIRLLLDQYILGEISATDRQELISLLNDPASEGILDNVMRENLMMEMSMAVPKETDQRLRNKLHERLSGHGFWETNSDKPAAPVRRIHYMKKWGWAAASVMVLLSIAVYFLVARSGKPTHIASVNNAVEVEPGKQGAVLTLSDGSQLLLDTIKNTAIPLQEGAIARIKDGVLSYEGKGNEVRYNTMTTPKGRQFQLTLPDGTGVWLNSASSIRYPTFFAGTERAVEITGEVYFEVAKNNKMPFRVNANNKARIDVLGTHFNVNAYANENGLNTTLLEGSVQVATEDLSGSKQHATPVVLRPGQQAQLLTGEYTQPILKVVNNSDIEKVMAWKNGLFIFKGATLEEVMRQLERWYNITVRYQKNVPQREFQGKLPKNLNLSQVLRILGEMDVKFRMESDSVLVVE